LLALWIMRFNSLTYLSDYLFTANLQAFCGPNVSSSKNVNRAGRHAAVSFVKRALARCRNYEEVGISCFDDPTFKDMFLSATSHRSSLDAASQGIAVTIIIICFVSVAVLVLPCFLSHMA
jgi:hypothetical protein